MSSSENLKDLDRKEIIALMDVYLKEWMHRDQQLWTQLFKYFYAALIVIILPNMQELLKVDISSVPAFFFRILGFLMSAGLLYIAIAFAKRLQAINNTYVKMYKQLNPKYHRDEIKGLPCGRCFTWRISYIISLSMPVSLMMIASVLFYFDLHKLCLI